VWLAVEDSGIGMTPEFQAVLFHGFQHPGETHDYSTRRPFDFGAGGRGLDLLRTRLFAERLGFRVHVSSEPCPQAHGPEGCPGRVEDCVAASGGRCAECGGSRFALEFPGELVETKRYVLGLEGQ
jgi:signal transduction histidine kinase